MSLRKSKNPSLDEYSSLIALGAGLSALFLFWPRDATANTGDNMNNTPSQVPPAPESATSIMARTSGMSQTAREREFIRLINSGNVPSWTFTTVQIRNGLSVTPDFIAVGTDEDYIWVPLTPAGAMLVLGQIGFRLPTRSEAEAIYAYALASGNNIPFQSFTPTSGQTRWGNLAMTTSKNKIMRVLNGRRGLIDGHKKYVLGERNGKVLIYGGHYADGSLVQPYSDIHDASYLDYSHGIRGVVA